MIRKIVLSLLWVGFLAYGFGFAPPTRPDTWELIAKLSAGDWGDINPAVVALFNLMGVLPAIYACVLFFDGRGQKIPAFPFAIASFGLGAFALLPYLILRQPNPEFTGEKNWFLRLQDSRWLGILLTLATLSLLAFGLLNGNWPDFAQQWQTSKFIHVMSLDFCLLCLLFPTLLRDDMARRGIENPRLFWAVALVPLLGPLAYLCLRPRVESVNSFLKDEG